MSASRFARVLLGPLLAVAAGGALSVVPLLGTNVAGALSLPHTVFVSATSSPACGAPLYTTISAAVAGVAPWDGWSYATVATAKTW